MFRALILNTTRSTSIKMLHGIFCLLLVPFLVVGERSYCILCRIVCVNWQFYICLGRCGDHFLSWDLFDSRDHRHLVRDLFDPAFDQFHHRGLRTLPRLWVPRQWGRGGTLLGIKMILSLTIKPFYFKPGPCSPFFCECTHGEIRIKKALTCVLQKVKHAFFFISEWNNLSFYIA